MEPETGLRNTSAATRSRAPGPRPGAEPTPTTDSRDDLWCDIQRSARYHRAREAFFQRIAAFSTFATLIAGSGVVAALLGQAAPWLAIALAALVAVLQAMELSFQISASARLHASLAAEFLSLDRTLARLPRVSDATLRELRAEIAAIEIREPPVKRYLDLICHNQVAVMIGSNDIEPLTFWQRHLANVLSGDGALQRKA